MLSEDSIKQAIGEPLFKSKKLACCLTDNQLRFTFVNDAFLAISGYTRGELIGHSVSVLLGSNILKLAWKEFSYFLKNRKNRKDTWPLYHKDGTRMQAVIETSTITIEGNSYIFTVALDITSEESLRNKLSEAQKLLSETEIISGSGSFEYNPETEETIWSDGMYYLFDLTPSDPKPTLEEQRSMIPDADLTRYQEAIRKCIEEGEDFDIVITLNLPERKKYIHSVGRKEQGKEQWVFGSSKDITAQKKAQLRIEESENRYRILTESLPSIIWTADSDGYLNYMNRHGIAYFGVKAKNFTDWRWKKYIYPDEIEEADQKWFFGRQTGTAVNLVNRLKSENGSYKWFQILIIPQKNEHQEIDAWIGIATDINKRIKTEEQLLLANTRLRALIDASPVAIYSLNKEGVVQDFWNPAAEKLLGWEKNEIIGKKLPQILSEDEDQFDERIAQTIKEGEFYGIIERKNKFGISKKLEVTGGCTYDLNGEVTEIIVTLIDITELEKNRERLSNSLKEKETLLQEIHHRVKNNLAIVVSLLQLQVFRSDNEYEKYRLTEAQNRVHSIAMVHELLYQSDDFSSVDLITYYEKLIHTIRNSMQVNNSEVNIDLDIGISSLNINQAIPLGLLINELATNSFKYAFNEQGNEEVITLKIRRAGNRIFVTYSDNGPGFDMSTTEFKTGLGMKIIDSLLSQLDAEYTLDSVGHFEIKLNFLEKGAGPLERAKD